MGRAGTARRRRRDQHGIPRLQYCCHVLRGKHSSFGPSPALTKEAFNCSDKVRKSYSSKFNQIQVNSSNSNPIPPLPCPIIPNRAIFNAKSQGREGAKSFFQLGDSATCRLLPRKLSGLTVKRSALSVKSVKSVVQFLWLRLAARGCLSIFVPNLPKCLSMKNLQSKSGRFQSGSIKVNQCKSRCFFMFPVCVPLRLLAAMNPSIEMAKWAGSRLCLWSAGACSRFSKAAASRRTPYERRKTLFPPTPFGLLRCQVAQDYEVTQLRTQLRCHQGRARAVAAGGPFFILHSAFCILHFP